MITGLPNMPPEVEAKVRRCLLYGTCYWDEVTNKVYAPWEKAEVDKVLDERRKRDEPS